MEEIKLTYLNEKIRFDGSDTAVSECYLPDKPSDIVSIKGDSEIDELTANTTYLFYGYWSTYKNRQDDIVNQFNFKLFIEATPIDRNAISTYLARHGKGLGIGKEKAKKIAQSFGAKAVETCRNEPEVIASFAKISKESANQLAILLRLNRDREETMIKLIGMLDGRGFPLKTAERAFNKWGPIAPATIEKDPFRLATLKGCGFKLCDKFYIQSGLNPARIKRQAHCVTYAIRGDRSGSTWTGIDNAVAMLKGAIGTQANPRKAIELAVRAKRLKLKQQGESIYVADYRRAINEEAIAKLVHEAKTETITWPELDDIFEGTTETEHQKEQVAKILGTTIASLGGGPGTGKTFTSALIIRAMIKFFGPDQVAIAASTGKAGVRTTSAMQSYGITLRATTVHSLLGTNFTDGNFEFTYDQNNALPYKFILIDETSMLDTDLMRSLLEARAKGAILLLVGDIYQLPPVGHGKPLSDMIEAGLPYAELTEPRRNSGDIVAACQAIRQGKRFAFSDSIRPSEGKNFILLRAGSPDAQINKALQVCEIAKRQDLNPIWDVQIICAVNKKSELGRKNLNLRLQRELNPNYQQGNQSFFVSDKVVNSKNGWLKLDRDFRQSLANCPSEPGPFNTTIFTLPDGMLTVNEKGQIYIANGELGEVVAIQKNGISIQMSEPRRVIDVFVGKQEDDDDDESTGTGCNWELGYALSCHKFQGSEVAIAVVMLDTYGGAKMIQSREWLYTSPSRGKQLTFLVGHPNTAFGMLPRQSLRQRKTLLVETIREYESKSLTLSGAS